MARLLSSCWTRAAGARYPSDPVIVANVRGTALLSRCTWQNNYVTESRKGISGEEKVCQTVFSCSNTAHWNITYFKLWGNYKLNRFLRFRTTVTGLFTWFFNVTEPLNSTKKERGWVLSEFQFYLSLVDPIYRSRFVRQPHKLQTMHSTFVLKTLWNLFTSFVIDSGILLNWNDLDGN